MNRPLSDLSNEILWGATEFLRQFKNEAAAIIVTGKLGGVNVDDELYKFQCANEVQAAITKELDYRNGDI